MAEPPQSDVEAFLAFAEPMFGVIPRETATIFLKCNNNDINQAVNAYMDDQDPSHQVDEASWEEAPFNNEYGPITQQESEMRLNVNPNDGTMGPVLVTAPSRPPSRVSYQDIQHNEVMDMSHSVNHHSNDHAYAEAMKRSLDPSQQVNGIIDASGIEISTSHSRIQDIRFRDAWQSCLYGIESDVDASEACGIPNLCDQDIHIESGGFSLPTTSSIPEYSVIDVLDGAFWKGHSSTWTYSDFWVAEVKCVLIIRLERNDKITISTDPVRVPLEVNVSRWLQENFEQAQRITLQKTQYVEASQVLDQKLFKLQAFSNSSDPAVAPRDARKLISDCTKYLEKLTDKRETLPGVNVGQDTEAPIGPSYSQTLQQLKLISDTIEKKLEKLRQEKEILTQKFIEARSRNIASLEDTTSSWVSFALSGIGLFNSENSTTIFTKTPRKPAQVVETDNPSNMHTSWRKFDIHSAAGVTTRGSDVVTEQEVLQTANKAHPISFLIYAREWEWDSYESNGSDFDPDSIVDAPDMASLANPSYHTADPTRMDNIGEMTVEMQEMEQKPEILNVNQIPKLNNQSENLAEPMNLERANSL